MASGGAGTSVADPAPEQLFGLAEPDPEHTLGGLKDDVEPEHPSVIGAIGERRCCYGPARALQ
jgi:hypothetical protein